MQACCRRHRAAIVAAIRARETVWRLEGATALTEREQYGCRMRACALDQLANDLEDDERTGPRRDPRAHTIPRRKEPVNHV